jgi:hypothetical protein
MTQAGRLAGLEGSLSPAETVRRWLEEVRAFDSLDAYARSLGYPRGGVGPLAEIPRQVEAATIATMKGHHRDAVAHAARLANRDAVFLIKLVLELNMSAWAIQETGTLRWLSLSSELRALDAEARLGARDRRRIGAQPVTFEAWTRQASALALDVLTAAAARRLLEREFLGGQRALFPDVFADSVRLRQNATSILFEAHVVRQLLRLDQVSAEPAQPVSIPTVELLGLHRSAVARAATAAAAIVHEARMGTLVEVREQAPAVPSVEPRRSKARA